MENSSKSTSSSRDCTPNTFSFLLCHSCSFPPLRFVLSCIRFLLNLNIRSVLLRSTLFIPFLRIIFIFIIDHLSFIFFVLRSSFKVCLTKRTSGRSSSQPRYYTLRMKGMLTGQHTKFFTRFIILQAYSATCIRVMFTLRLIVRRYSGFIGTWCRFFFVLHIILVTKAIRSLKFQATIITTSSHRRHGNFTSIPNLRQCHNFIFRKQSRSLPPPRRCSSPFLLDIDNTGTASSKKVGRHE
mmetsp:Transcript_8264/g.11375  ORF Transcript_8264/g.11375 Transcript_8264/m.11375 type:complete len:240 (-) Transcript_8264:1040-1759(-)